MRFSNCEDVINTLLGHDFICICETWCEEKEKLINVFDGYVCYSVNAKRYNKHGRASGGIAVFIKQEAAKSVTHLCVDYNLAVILSINGAMFNLATNIILVCTYVPPEGSVFYANSEIDEDNGIDLLKDKIIELKGTYPNAMWCMFGDFNARTSQKPDYINDECNNVPGMEWYIGDDFMMKRQSKDHVVNKFGNSLIDMCIELNMHITNGRFAGDEKGEFTFINQNGCSVIDYGVMSTELFSLVHDFAVLTMDVGCHFPILCTLKCHKDVYNGNVDVPVHSYYRCKWCDENKSLFMSNLGQSDATCALDNVNDMCTNGGSVDDIVEKFNNVLYCAGKHMFYKCGGKHIKKSNSKKDVQPRYWDRECDELKMEKYRLLNVYRRGNAKTSLHRYLDAKKEFKITIKKKRKLYESKLRCELEESCNDQKLFWRCVKNIGNKNECVESCITSAEWYSHFSNLLSKKPEVDENFNKFVNQKLNEHEYQCGLCANEPENDDILNKEIDFQEVQKIVKELPSGKSAGEDGFVYEVFKVAFTKIGPCIVNLFNKIMLCGEFPTGWACGLLCTLHKKGSRKDPNNYRGISLLPALSKIFSKVLNNRLVKFAEMYKLQHEEQAAYRKGYSTIDQIFVLQSLIQNQLCQKRGRYYVIFVDFQKAFDSIPHSLLIHTLIKQGIHGRLLKILISLYDKLKACVRVKEGATDCFDCNIGTRQGCILSPFLFSLYMNELIDMLHCFECMGIYVNQEARNIMILMYADDIAQGANHVIKLQAMINVLSEFCKKWGLQINRSKTQIMVFRNGGKVAKDEKWHFRDQNLCVVPLYKYLGVIFTSSLSWSKAVYTLAMQARKGIAMLRKYSKACGGLPVKVAFKLFDQSILPIMLYGAEVWGHEYFKVLEDVQIQFCKTTLGLPKQGSNNAALGECGRSALAQHSYVRCIKYWLKILEMPNTRYVKCCYMMLKRLDETGKSTWASSVKQLLFKYGFGVVWLEQGAGNSLAFLNEFKVRIKDCFSQEWYRQIHDSSKLSIYCTFKSLLEPEKYLKCVTVWDYRKAMARFRCSSHRLTIERGRYDGILMENRLCTFCENMGITVIEDEFHFLLCCSQYVDLRSELINVQYTDRPNFHSFIMLMSSQDEDVIKNIAKYIFKANKIREQLCNL